MISLRLRSKTPESWLEVALADLDAFLQDHAANERKVSQSALTLAVHHPEEPELAAAMIDLAREELDHFKIVHDLLAARGRRLAQDAPDPYMGALGKLLRRRRREEYLLDRLLVFAVVEARGCERFAMLARALRGEPLGEVYARLTRAEARHGATFLRLARRLFPETAAQRLDQILDAEAKIARALPLRPALH